MAKVLQRQGLTNYGGSGPVFAPIESWSCERNLIPDMKAAASRGNAAACSIRKNGAGHKPGSVVGSHPSRAGVTARLKQPTREPRGPRERSPIWPCSGWGLPCRRCCHRRGALLPHPFTLTIPKNGGLLSAALSVGSRRPGVTWHPALWSPDFPPPPAGGSGCLADSRPQYTAFGRPDAIGTSRARRRTLGPYRTHPPRSGWYKVG